MASALLNWKKNTIKEFNCVYGRSVCACVFVGRRGGGGAEGVASDQILKKKGGLTGSQFLERGCWERGRGEGVCSFYIKNKLNLKYLTTKKVYKQKCVFFLA